MKRILFVIFAILLFAGSSFAAEVKNVKAQQAGNRVLFEFDITGDEGETEVSVTLIVNGKTYTGDKLHLEGDYGKVKVGNGKKIYWNVLQDFPRGLSTAFDYEIVAGGFQLFDLTVLDKQTKLMWTRDANIARKEMGWDDAFEFIKSLNWRNYAGYSDWRLPTKEELETLVNYAKSQGYKMNISKFLNNIGFKNVEDYGYWSSTTHADLMGSAWRVNMDIGGVGDRSKASHYSVLPVRAGQ